MKKIVINQLYDGGFDLSILAIKKYLKLKGKESYFYKLISNRGSNFFYKKLIKPRQNESLVVCFTKDFGKKIYVKDISNEERKLYYFNKEDILRDDKDLINVVEKLGGKANTKYSFLKIIEIPDDVEWSIYEYDDGMECVVEKSRSWY